MQGAFPCSSNEIESWSPRPWENVAAIQNCKDLKENIYLKRAQDFSQCPNFFFQRENQRNHTIFIGGVFNVPRFLKGNKKYTNKNYYHSP